jgi:hypothetical protein
MCKTRRALNTPKIDAGISDDYTPASNEIDDALLARKAIKKVFRTGEARLDHLEKKSLSSFSLHKLSGILRGEAKQHLSDRIYPWPALGASKTPMYAAFAIGQGWDSGVLLDTDPEGYEAKKKIDKLVLKEFASEQQARFRVLMLGKAAGIKKTDAAIEDLFDDEFYVDCVNAPYHITIKSEDLPTDGSDMITKRVEAVLVQRYGRKELDKRRVMSEILRRFDGWQKLAELPAGAADRAEKLFESINNAFGETSR